MTTLAIIIIALFVTQVFTSAAAGKEAVKHPAVVTVGVIRELTVLGLVIWILVS